MKITRCTRCYAQPENDNPRYTALYRRRNPAIHSPRLAGGVRFCRDCQSAWRPFYIPDRIGIFHHDAQSVILTDEMQQLIGRFNDTFPKFARTLGEKYGKEFDRIWESRKK